jgi:hypothetical protein
MLDDIMRMLEVINKKEERVLWMVQCRCFSHDIGVVGNFQRIRGRVMWRSGVRESLVSLTNDICTH